MCCYYVHYSEHRKKGRKVRKNQPTERFKWEHLKGARGGGLMIQILELILKTLFQGKNDAIDTILFDWCRISIENQ